jgi:CRP-like cAMP-binding protein
MARPSQLPSQFLNSILQSLEPATLKHLRDHLHPLDLVAKQVLHESGQPFRNAYFVEAGMVSVVAITRDSRAIEVGTIGREGVVGSEILLGARSLPFRKVVQVAGNGYRIGAELLQREVDRSAALRAHILRSHVAALVQSMQSVACNGLHNVEQRCCRWILTARDHADSDSIHLTHEFLAVMLGVRRASVTDVLRPLQERGLIQSSRGVLTILRRDALAAKACECYELVTSYRRELLN